LNTTLSPPFSPYVNDLYFLHGAFIFEDVGVTAYKGALTSFQSKDIMLAAAGKCLLPVGCSDLLATICFCHFAYDAAAQVACSHICIKQFCIGPPAPNAVEI